MTMLKEIFIVRNKRNLNKVLKRFKPEAYAKNGRTVYDWMSECPEILPVKYPAAVVISFASLTTLHKAFKIEYLYVDETSQIHGRLIEALCINERTTRGRKMAGTRPRTESEKQNGFIRKVTHYA